MSLRSSSNLPLRFISSTRSSGVRIRGVGTGASFSFLRSLPSVEEELATALASCFLDLDMPRTLPNGNADVLHWAHLG